MAWLRAKAPFFILGALAAAALFVWSVVFAAAETGRLKIYMFDVGQGDAIFIETPDHYQILIDGGPSDRVLELLGRVMPFWDREIDLMVLTHPHADHVTGLIHVLGRYRAGTILESNAHYTTAEYAAWEAAKKEAGMLSYPAVAGMQIPVGGEVLLDVLAPFSDSTGLHLKNIHDAMVVLQLSYRAFDLLLMGDAEITIERPLIAGRALRDVDVLKIGHHGSKTSTTEGFLHRTLPEYALISVGAKNRYGHPHASVLERLEANGVAVLRTDVLGDLLLESDGTHFYSHESFDL
jgi:competence protein ComEC